MYDITGRTRLFGIVADPIMHVKTPQVINALLRRLEFDGMLVPFHVAPPELVDAFKMFRATRNLGGFIVTVPHKSAAVALCDAVEIHARRLGAINCVRRDPDGRLVGTMLDGMGFVEGLRRNGIEPRGLRVYLAGAGGAASAIAFALAEAGVRSLAIGNRSQAKADDLAGRLRADFPSVETASSGQPADADLVVNATSLGLRAGDPLPIVLDGLGANHIVAEIVMDPEMTPLLQAARARGCRIHLGRHMLEAQAEAMIRHMGVETP